jgi:hypothetical protein
MRLNVHKSKETNKETMRDEGRHGEEGGEHLSVRTSGRGRRRSQGKT